MLEGLSHRVLIGDAAEIRRLAKRRQKNDRREAGLIQERYEPNSTISVLLGHSRPIQGFGQESRVTVGYSHTTWEAMCRAVESLEYEPSEIVVFGAVSRKSREKPAQNEGEQTQVKAG